MVKVITYGTYDLLHEGHIRLLKRARALGDYLIVGVTGDGFDLTRGKINVQQSLIERIEGVKATGLADEIIVEEYEGQKIDDIKRYEVDIFTVGSDWIGKFDYLNEYCKVVYLERTEGISSSDLRAERSEVKLGLIGHSQILHKFVRESKYVNGVQISGICTDDISNLSDSLANLPVVTNSYDELYSCCDAVYIISSPEKHRDDVVKSLNAGKHVLCEAPIALSVTDYQYLIQTAKNRNLILMDGIKTAYSTAFNRMILLIKGGLIGKVVSVDATCTSLRDLSDGADKWNAMTFWGPTGLLPVFDIFGTNIRQKEIISHVKSDDQTCDLFSKINLLYRDSVASVKIGQGVKSEGELIVSGTKGYIYVPAPWWKTDYFEVRFENQSENRRFFYQLEGEGIRFEILSFVRQIRNGNKFSYIPQNITRAMIEIFEDFYKGYFISI